MQSKLTVPRSKHSDPAVKTEVIFTSAKISEVPANSFKMVTGPSLVLRVGVLFSIGMLFCMLLELLQAQRHTTVFHAEVLTSILASAWWMAPCCGAASALIGLLYPFLDKQLGKKVGIKEWSSVMRCIAVFMGINHACAKIDFANNLQLSASLAAMSLGLWWLFDRSVRGFGLCAAFAILATVITQLLVFTDDFYRYSEADVLFIHSWLPFIYFSGGVTMGFIGRQLAASDGDAEEQKVKVE